MVGMEFTWSWFFLLREIPELRSTHLEGGKHPILLGKEKGQKGSRHPPSRRPQS